MADLSQSPEPIFVALARIIANGILTGIYPPGGQVPSTTELAAFFKINPITAGRALTQLTDKGVLEKRRGIGTFVTQNAVESLKAERLEELDGAYIDPLIEEAGILGIPISGVIERIKARSAEASKHTATDIITEGHPDDEE